MKRERTENQHHVPRFYLEYFENCDGKIWTYDNQDDKHWATSPDKTARQKNIYSVKDSAGEYIDDLEDWFTDVETKASILYPKVISGENLENQERADFSVFLASLYMRSPSILRSAAEMSGYMIQHLLDVYVRDRDAYDSLVDRMDKESGQTTSVEERDRNYEFVCDRDRYTIEVNQDSGLRGLTATDRLSPIFFRMKWDLIIVDGLHLITGDNPLVRVTPPEDHHPMYGDSGFLGKRVEVTLPLSPTLLLMLHWDDTDGQQTYHVSAEHGRIFNAQRAYFADRFLFSSRDDPEVWELGREYKDCGLEFVMSGQDRFADVNVTR